MHFINPQNDLGAYVGKEVFGKMGWRLTGTQQAQAELATLFGDHEIFFGVRSMRHGFFHEIVIKYCSRDTLLFGDEINFGGDFIKFF